MVRPRSASAVLLVTRLLALQLLLLRPLPAAAANPSSLLAVARPSPATTKLIILAVKKLAKVGTKAMIKKKYGNRDKDLLGSAAADDVGYVVMNVSAGSGTTATTFSGVVDILYELVWVPCPKPPAPAFSRVPCASQTCMSLLNMTGADCGRVSSGNCEYVAVYGPGMNTTGYVSSETFTVVGTERVIAGPMVFGCSTASTTPFDEGQSSVISLSRAPYSLVSQLKTSKFSYFLAPNDADSSDSLSVVLLGDAAVPQTKQSHSTPLLRSPFYPNFYYVNLTGIQVNGQAVDGIPKGAFNLAAGGGSGGVVMSTLNVVSYLQPAAYAAVRRVLVSKINSMAVDGSALAGGAFDLCYNARSVAGLTFPKLTLVFGGWGGDAPPTMELTTAHYFYKDNATGLQCLTLLPTPAGSVVGSVLGTLLQTGTNMIYDVGEGRLTFEKAAAPPAGKQRPLMVAVSLLAWVLLF